VVSHAPEHEKEKPKERLQSALGFTLEDLQVNGVGRITALQRGRLFRTIGIWLSLSVITAIGWVINFESIRHPQTNSELGSAILILLLLSFLFA
jgi:hypothetical protein